MFTSLLVVVMSVGVLSQNEVVAYTAIANSAFGCIKGVVGAEKGNRISACLGGMAGGAVSTLGMGIAHKAVDVPFTGLAGKLTNDIGLSIQYNTMMGKMPLDRFMFDIGPVILSIDSNSVKWKISMASVAGLRMASLNKNTDFSVRKSIENGIPVFMANGDMSPDLVGSMINGITLTNSIMIAPQNDKMVLSHELHHVLQWQQLRGLKMFSEKTEEEMHWDLSLDVSSVVFLGVNLLINKDNYWSNPVEQGARAFE